MALRIHEQVVRGDLDNRLRGRVRGQIWLVGRDQPITLELSGNCLRDLAGCLINFSNPNPSAGANAQSDLAPSQEGIAGEITASHRVRVFDVPLEEAIQISREGGTPPEHMANSLYIEWFSDASGRVVIESADYIINVSPPAWTLSREEEQQQIETSHDALRDWLDRLDGADQYQQPNSFDPDEEKPLDEFGYEKLMRESDVKTDKYMELLEKYDGHLDQERIVAREMGWTWLEEALEADERGALPEREPMEVPELVPNPATEGIDWIRDEDGDIHHPLQKRAFETAMEMWHFCDDNNLLGEEGDADVREMIFEAQTLGAKLAGALNGLGYEEDTRDGGFVVATLKRALIYLHKSLAAADKVAEKKLLPNERLERFRIDLFEIREEMLRLMQRFRDGES